MEHLLKRRVIVACDLIAGDDPRSFGEVASARAWRNGKHAFHRSTERCVHVKLQMDICLPELRNPVWQEIVLSYGFTFCAGQQERMLFLFSSCESPFRTFVECLKAA